MRQNGSTNRISKLGAWLRRSPAFFATITLFCSVNSPASPDKSNDSEKAFSIDIPYAEADVSAIVQSVAEDHVIRGTYVYEREKILNEAAPATSSPYFGPWTGQGHVFYKVRKDALAPRNFKNSADIGTITVRYVVRTASPMATHLEIEAVFVEDGTRRVHPSNSSVESAEFTEIQNQLQALQKDRQQSEARREQKQREEEQAAATVRQLNEEEAAYRAAESSLGELQKRAEKLRHDLEARTQKADTELKAAPFGGAATLVKLPAHSDVLVEILTNYWFGVETVDGHRGWIRRDQVEPLP